MKVKRANRSQRATHKGVVQPVQRRATADYPQWRSTKIIKVRCGLLAHAQLGARLDQDWPFLDDRDGKTASLAGRRGLLTPLAARIQPALILAVGREVPVRVAIFGQVDGLPALLVGYPGHDGNVDDRPRLPASLPIGVAAHPGAVVVWRRRTAGAGHTGRGIDLLI